MKDRRLKTERRRLRSTISKGIIENQNFIPKLEKIRKRGTHISQSYVLYHTNYAVLELLLLLKCYFLFNLENNCLLYL